MPAMNDTFDNTALLPPPVPGKHHTQEWAGLAGEGRDGIVLTSRYAEVTITCERALRRADAWISRYLLRGGRIDGPKTWQARLRGCDCEQPACKSAGKVRRYSAAKARQPGGHGHDPFGRIEPGSCGAYGYCHRRGGYVPADVVALARLALESWAPVKAWRPAPLPAIRYDPKHVPTLPDPADELVRPSLGMRLAVRRADAIRAAGQLQLRYCDPPPPRGWVGRVPSRASLLHLPGCPAAQFEVVEYHGVPALYTGAALHGYIDAALYCRPACWCPDCLGADALLGQPVAECKCDYGTDSHPSLPRAAPAGLPQVRCGSAAGVGRGRHNRGVAWWVAR